MKTFALHIKVQLHHTFKTKQKENKNFKNSHASKCEGANIKDDPKVTMQQNTQKRGTWL